MKKPAQDKEKVKELTETLQRLQAEFENYKKRTERENAESVKFANKELILKILPVIDNLELALKGEKRDDTFFKGVELIYSQLMGSLEEYGLKHIPCVGEMFDAYRHEAMLAVESEEEKNTILEELQKGYMLHDKVIRPAKVKVAK